ncbi:hypothetical protein [Xenorhabdus szentirmaii]|nr:hypothetical protein [Xenorhabdus sp. ZM]
MLQVALRWLKSKRVGTANTNKKQSMVGYVLSMLTMVSEKSLP